MLQVQDPGGVRTISPLTMLRILPSPLRDKVGHLTTVRFRGYSFHLRCVLLPPCLRFKAVVPAHLRVDSPRAPQNSVPGRWLGFTGAAIPDRLVLCASRRTPHRTVREPLDSYGSYRPAFTVGRRLGYFQWAKSPHSRREMSTSHCMAARGRPLKRLYLRITQSRRDRLRVRKTPTNADGRNRP